ncbi:MAG: YigZ family protein [Bacteroidetes bacterium]|nr:YigZ family protein [Bacteroidota bacterium]
MQDDFSYLSIAAAAEGVYTEKGSKFIGCAFPFSSESELKNQLDFVKKKYIKARHYCYAYQIGGETSNYRINDDGEPSGTAGKPIHGQIRSNELSDILIIVVRYFGGTLLGASGLIHAYKTAAAEAIKNSEIITKTPMETVHISFYFSELNEIMKIAKQKNVSILDKQIQNECTMALSFPKSDEVKLRKQMDKVMGLRFL